MLKDLVEKADNMWEIQYGKENVLIELADCTQNKKDSVN